MNYKKICNFAKIITVSGLFLAGCGNDPGKSDHVHTGNHYLGHAPTCEKSGLIEYWECSKCNKVFFDADSDDVKNGKWTTVSKTPKNPYEDAVIEASGHRWVYTEIDEGFYDHHCEFCDERIEGVEVSSQSELIAACEEGKPSIKLLDDIIVTQPIYVKGRVGIFAEEDHSITRDPAYDGDIFVVGTDASNGNLVVQGYDSYLTIGKSTAHGVVTVDGNKESATVDSKGSLVFVANSGVFTLNNNARLINNKKVDNIRSKVFLGDSEGQGAGGSAVLIANGLFTMNGGTISNCESEQSSLSTSSQGGAIYCHGSFLMKGGEISSNKSYYGGAIFNMKEVRIVNGTISGNTSYSGGGAIYQNPHIIIFLTIGDFAEESTNKVVISNNESLHGNGGAIFSDFNSSIEIVGHTEIKNNASFYHGAGICVHGQLTITGKGNLFESNTAGVGSGEAGAIYILHKVNSVTTNVHRPAVIDGATFKANSGYNGGAIKVSGETLNASNCVFENNSAESRGGAIYAVKSEFNENSTVNLTNVTLRDNSGIYGGALTGYKESTVSISGETLITGNTATSQGGFAYFDNSTLNINGTEASPALISSNKTNNDSSGGIHACNGSSTTLSKVIFNANHAKTHGGAIYGISSSSTAKTNISLTDVIFSNNVADGNGGCVYTSNAILTGTNVTFSSNHANGSAGGIHENNSSIITLTNATFDGNSTDGDAGTINASNSSLTLIDSSFSNNSTNYTAAAIWAQGTTSVSLTNTNFSNNSAKNAGAIKLDGSSSLSMNGGTFSENNAINSGGAVTVNTTGNVEFNGVDFNENTTTNYYGGAIYLISGAFSANNCNFEGNKALKTTSDGCGGAAYLTAGSASFDNCSFDGNTAYYGGAMRVMASATLVVTDCQFSENSAKSGGVFYFNNTTAAEISGSTFTENVANSWNGGVGYFAANSKADFEECSFIDNVAQADGGVFCANASGVVVVLTDITVDGNHTTNSDNRNFMHINGGAQVTLNGYIVVSNPQINIGGSGYLTVYTTSLEWEGHIEWADLLIGGGSTTNVTYLSE